MPLLFTENRQNNRGLSATTNPRSGFASVGLPEATAAETTAGTAANRYISPRRLSSYVSTAIAAQSLRTILTGNQTYYVRTDGSNSNVGTADTAGGAWLTIQYALNYVLNHVDLSGYDVTIQVRSGTFAGATISSLWTGGGTVTLTGDTATPANVNLSSVVTIQGGAVLQVSGFKISTSTTGFLVQQSSLLTITGNMNFGACTTRHLAIRAGGILQFANSPTITVSGSSPIHLAVGQNALVQAGTRTVAFTSSPAFSTAFLNFNLCGTADFSNTTFTGSATGTGWLLSTNSAVEGTAGGAKLTATGLTSGTTATGGQIT